jgi:RNase P/RNase MRP subunit POP5|tara:strand:- start:407 stop:742 length:336 start_codon:yes stop_codon:yes gene_type:complete
MAKRLSKALRGKRRWIGVQISANVHSRSETKSLIERISNDLQLSANPKLMDFEQNVLSNGCGTGIIQVNLTDYMKFRTHISTVESLNIVGMSSITSSGKIRLVRERLSELE